MDKQQKIVVKRVEIALTQIKQEDFICITDIAKYKNLECPADIIKNWIRNKNTIELTIQSDILKLIDKKGRGDYG